MTEKAKGQVFYISKILFPDICSLSVTMSGQASNSPDTHSRLYSILDGHGWHSSLAGLREVRVGIWEVVDEFYFLRRSYFSENKERRKSMSHMHGGKAHFYWSF